MRAAVMMAGVLRFGALRQARIDLEFGQPAAGNDDIAGRTGQARDLAGKRRGHVDDGFRRFHRNQRFVQSDRVADLDVPFDDFRFLQALAQVGETRLASVAEAEELGFPIDESGDHGIRPDADGKVEIPLWRHAVIQFPHPLLEQGLVILDTPGLNAIGAEPELTLNLLPNAHAVLFILAADTGVTQSDLAVWREHVNAGRRQRGRIVALNKIDGLWDGLRSEADIEREIAGQVASVASTLEIGPEQVYPVSAQKGLVAKVNDDAELLERSRILQLERALSTELLPTKRDIVRDNTYGDITDIVDRSRELLNARLTGLQEQLQELTDLRGKNQNVIEYMMRKVRSEKDEFEQGLQKYYAVRSVFSNLSNNLFGHLGLDALRDETRRTREAMLDAAFSRGLREAMKGFFQHLRSNLHKSTEEIGEISKMLDAMYKRFTVEHGLKLAAPTAFSTLRYEKEIERLEAAFNSQFNTVLTIVTTEKHTLTQKFFETVAVEARRTFEVANRDAEQWLRAVMAPLETQVREYQLQLKRRLESVKRIHQATDTLENRVNELQQAETLLVRQLEELQALSGRIERALDGHEARRRVHIGVCSSVPDWRHGAVLGAEVAVLVHRLMPSTPRRRLVMDVTRGASPSCWP